MSPTTTDSARSRGVVRRIVQVMNAFTEQPQWGVRELAARLEVPKSGLHRTLQEMAVEHLLSSAEDGSYVASAELLRLASGLVQSADLTRIAHPHMLAARDATHETTLLVAYDDNRRQIIALDAVASDHPIQFVWAALREWTDLHLSASGKAILASLPPTDLVNYFATPRVDVKGRPVTLRSMERELRRIRDTGWAITHGDRIPGTTGVCSPILNGRDRVVGGIVIAWPNRQTSVDEEFIGRTCMEAARATSVGLGWLRG
ncbi:IclR family transcriptional regulator [Dactylosporangium salmoneum]|uniref:IclR family transcriptional regulator n=1 Tax=Dactylosporangium salmoneum TaxID=53361 RepID=A0ABP5SY99_9ACTN